MPANVDHTADSSGVELLRLFEAYGDVIPDFVKRANFDAVMRPGRQPVTVYADPVRRQFPCQNAASTFLSVMFYQEKRAEFHPKDQASIERRLDHYVDYFAIRGPVDRLKEARELRVKSAAEALPDSSFAYVWVGEDGTKERWMRMTTAAEVKQAADALESIAPRMPFSDRHVVARRVLEKAAAFGAALRPEQLEFLERQAGRGVCDRDAVVAMLRGRAKLAADGPLRLHLQKLADSVAATPAVCLDPNALVKLAETVYQVDASLGVRPDAYSDKLPRPEDVLFEVTFTKTARDLAQKVATTSGTVYDKKAFAGLSVEELRSVFGDDFADEVKCGSGGDKVDLEKMADLVPTLPRPEAEILDQLMGSRGERPALRKAASCGVGFTREQLAKIAGFYAPPSPSSRA